MRSIFRDILRYLALRVLGETLPEELERSAGSIIRETEEEFIRRDFTQDKTPYSEKQSSGSPGIMWGREKLDPVSTNENGSILTVPNAGFAIVEPQKSEKAATFSGPTTVAIDRVMRVLADKGLSPPEIEDALLPCPSCRGADFADWGGWSGDVTPGGKPDTVTSSSNVSLASYYTRSASVLRRYERLSENLGRIKLYIDGGRKFKENLTIDVRFA